MVRFIATAILGLAAFFVQDGIEKAMPDLSPWESWGIAGALFIIGVAVLYFPKWWPLVLSSGTPARAPATHPSLEGPTPDGTLPELIQHMQSAGIDLDRSIYEIEDKARLGQLACWGRRYSVAGPGRNPNPLRDIPQEHWDHYALDMLRCAAAQTDEEASLCCTRPRSSNFREHDYNGTFQDLRVNRPQAMALWPSSKGKKHETDA